MRKIENPQKEIILVGAGNSHLQCVRRFGMEGISGTRMTLVNDFPVMPYSGMIPGVLANLYSPEEMEIDLRRLCTRAGVRFIEDEAIGIARQESRLLLKSRPALRYDFLSINVGSRPFIPPGVVWQDNFLSVKPLGNLLRRLRLFDAETRGFRLLIVGGGASGCELGFALRKRFSALSDVSIEILTRGSHLLDGFAPAVVRETERALREHHISHRTGVSISHNDSRYLYSETGERFAFDFVLWATSAAPVDWISKLDLETDARGFLSVDDELRSVSDPKIFGTGDCVTLRSNPDTPKAGVFAVREGPFLFHNLRAAALDTAPKAYHPQRLYLFLLNVSDGTAILSYGRLAARGKWALGWKGKIDRKWVRGFQDFYGREFPSTSELRCGGCGSKVAYSVLEKGLSRLKLPTRSEFLPWVREDASAHRLEGGKIELQSLDFFKAFTDDYYLLGKIAALHALSDLDAKNAESFSALVLACFPQASPALVEEDLFQLLSGVSTVLEEQGVALAGGHTSELSEAGIGLSVTGYAKEAQLFQKNALNTGDVLILTKPLGSGALWAASMRAQLRSSWAQPLLNVQLQPNRSATRLFAKHGVRACTDVTGFGLAGHLFEMLEACGLSARIHPASIPVLPGALECFRMGIKSSLHAENERLSVHIEGDSPEILFDPQTSGGLLAAVPAEKRGSVLSALGELGYEYAAEIGEVHSGPPRIFLVEQK